MQKISNYSKRLAIVGDFSQIKSEALRDFIYESNRTKKVIFVKTVEDALKIFEKKENKKIRGTPAIHGGRFVAIFTAHNRTVYASPLKRLGVPFR